MRADGVKCTKWMDGRKSWYYKQYLRAVTQKKTIVYADYDTAIGMKELLMDLSLESEVFIKYVLSTDIMEGRIVKPSDAKLKSTLNSVCWI